MNEKTNLLVENTRKYGEANVFGKVWYGFILAIIAAVIVTVLQLIWNWEPVRDLRNTIADLYSDWRSPKTDVPPVE